MPSPIKGLGLGMDELEQLVSSTFRDFDLYNPDLQLEQLLAPPSTFDDHDRPRSGAGTPAVDHPPRPASRLTTTTTLLRKVKSHASAFLTSRATTPKPPKSPALPPRERTKSVPKPMFPFRRGSEPKPPLPPVPPLPRTPAASLDHERTHLPYPTRTYTPIPAPDSPASGSSLGSPSRAKRRGGLPSVFESDNGTARALFVNVCEPPSPPPKSPRHNQVDTKPLLNRIDTGSFHAHQLLSVHSRHPDILWTPELTNASPSQSSPASSQSSAASNKQSPITPSNEESVLFDNDDPFRKEDPPNQLRLSSDASPPRPRAPRSKSAPKMHKSGIRPSPSLSLHPALTLASASPAHLPHDPAATVNSTPRGALVSSANGSSLFLPFPLPPDATEDVISVRVATPVGNAFPPARPPPVRPLPKTPPGSPWRPSRQPRTAPPTQTTFGFPSPKRIGAKVSSSRSTKRSLSRSGSREKLSALRQVQAASKSVAVRPLPSRPHYSNTPPSNFDAFLAYAAPRAQPQAPILQAPPLGRRRRRPSSPFPLLESTPAVGPTHSCSSAGDGRVISLEPHPRPPRAARQEVRAVVDAMLAGDVSFTNPWASPTLSTSDMESHLDMLPDSDLEPDAFAARNWKKSSVSSASTVFSTRTASSTATQSTVTNATTISPSTSPDTTSPYIGIAPLPLDHDNDPLGLAARSTAPWARPHKVQTAILLRNNPSASSGENPSLECPRPSHESDGKSETYYTAGSRSSSPRRSEADTSAPHPLPPVSYAHTADLTAIRRAQSPVPFPRMIPAPLTAPAYVATFVQAESAREHPPPMLCVTAPSPFASNAPASPSGGRKRRSFLPLPAIPRIAPLDFGILGHSSEREDRQGRKVTGSGWFD